MSFPKASIKRFNDNQGCAPPPGTYDPKQCEKAAGFVVDKTERFKIPKAEQTFNVSSFTSTSTPNKKPPPPPNKKPLTTVDQSQVKELEKEIRKLVKERTDREKLLSQKEEELRKLDGRLHNATLERSSLQARIAGAEKELKEAKKSNDLLKNRVSTSENVGRKYEEVQAEVTTLRAAVREKDGEITRLREQLEATLATLVGEVAWLDSSLGGLEGMLSKDGKGEDMSQMKADGTVSSPTRTRKTADILKRLQNEKLTTDEKFKLVKKAYEVLHARMTSVFQRLESQTSELVGQYEGLVSTNSQLKAAVQDIQGQLHEALQARTELETHRKNLEENTTFLQTQIESLSNDNNFMKDNIKSLTVNIEELQVDKSQLQLQFDDLQQVHETAVKENCEKLRFLEDREVLVSQSTSGLHERIVELQAENEDLAATLKETGELLSRTKEENARLEEMFEHAECKWQGEKKHLLIQVEELVIQKSMVESQLTDTEVKVKLLECDLVDQKAYTEEQIQNLLGQLDGEKAELVQLQNKLGDLVYEKSQLHTEIGHLEAQMKLVKCEVDETKCEADKVVDNLKERLEKLTLEKTKSDDKTTELKNQNETLQCTLEKFQSDFDDFSEKCSLEKNDAQSRVSDLISEVDGLREQRDQMSHDLEDIQLEKAEVDMEVAKLQCRINVLEMESNQTREEYEEQLAHNQDEISAIRGEKEQMERDMERHGIDLLTNASQIRELQEQLQFKTSECGRLEAEIEGLQDQLKGKDEALTGVQADLADLQKSYDQKVCEIEELSQETDRLADQLQTQGEKYEDLESQYQQARADFLKRCDERDELSRKNEAKDASIQIMSTQLIELEEKMKTQDERHMQELKEQDAELTAANQKVSNYKQQIVDYKEHLQTKSEEVDELQLRVEELDAEITMAAREAVDYCERIDILKSEKEVVEVQKSALVEEYEKQLTELRDHVTGATNTHEIEQELARYRQLYEDLQAKVEPFMDQLDAFEAEKNMLLGQNKDVQAEIEKLGRNYAQLLGHQNQKQKIKHIVKIKDENGTLKKENFSLKEQVEKQKRHIRKLEEKTVPRRFAPEKAFQHGKENITGPAPTGKSPLREVNRK
ncbi:hyaluronan mediated motility receptor-like [Mya arenaria]|uniref:hyaluronan mediated motility receptor-like n=1 Tax=Mya arenaria TaxID=6604 RepID=UPI0022E66031|nr:hyaluronan mediated motility receptor-like [Mya arenaria]